MNGTVMLHVIAGCLVVGLAATVGIWGLARSASASGRGREGASFHQAVALLQTAIVATGLVGLALLADGEQPSDPLHARVYGPFMVVAFVAAWGFRGRDPRANVRIFAACALAVLALGLRALVTGN